MDFRAPNSVFKLDQNNNKQIYKERQCFEYIAFQFLQLSDAKLKEGIFDGPQIQKLLKDDFSVTKMTHTEKSLI